MRYTTLIATMFATFSIATFATGADPAKPDFSGTWELDGSKSEGMPPDTKQTMTVKQSGDRLDVEVKINGPQGDRTVSDVYMMNGEESEFTPTILGGGKAKPGKRVSKWAAGEPGFDATEKAVVEGPEGEDELTGKRRWRLSADGKTITIDIDLEGSQGPLKSKRVFQRK